jgi:pilus assembly protein CpaE
MICFHRRVRVSKKLQMEVGSLSAIKVFIADGKPETNIELRSFFSKSTRLEIVGECSDGELAVKMCIETKPDVVLLDMDLPGIDGLTLSRILTSIMQNVLIIMTCSSTGKDNVKKAMAAGARDLIVKPFLAHEITHSVISLYDTYKKSVSIVEKKDYKEVQVKPEVITIFSTKGGVGKTTVASNIAAAIAKKTKEKVVLLDFDFQFGDVPIMFNLYPKRTILELVNEIQELDMDVLEEHLIEHPSGLKILPAPDSPEYAEYITPQNIEKIIKLLLQNYRYIIIDTAPTFNEVNLTALDASDKIFFLTTLDLSTIKNVKLGLQVMNTLNYEDSKVNILLNRYHSRFGISKKELEKTIGKKIIYTIPEDPITAIHSMNKGNPFVLNRNKGKLAQSIIEIADSIAADKKVARKGFFTKLLG